MEDEYYNIEVEFTSQETQSNMEKGQIYLQSKFSSYRQHHQPLIFHRMGQMQVKASLYVYIKEFIRSLPLIGYLCNCEPSQQIVIPIVENFNNADFKTSSIELTLTNTALTFQSVVIRMRSSLFGIRYLMRHWFFTTAIVAVSCMTSSLFFSFVAFYFMIKSSLKAILLSIYPEAKSLNQRQSSIIKAKKKYSPKDSEDEYTDDPFTSGDTSSEDDITLKKKQPVEQKKNIIERILVFIFKALVW